MKIVIDIVLVVIVALCAWHGYKKGIIGGVAGILAVVIALAGGNLLSSAISHEVVPVLEPFVNGYIDSQNTRDTVLERMGYGESDLSLEDILAQDSSLRYDYAYECMSELGFYKSHAEKLADKAVDYSDETGSSMTESVIAVLCDAITYVAGLVLFFLMILIFLVAIGNIGNLSFRLPGIALADGIGGAVLGFLKGALYCALICWLLGFFGFIIGKETLEDTVLAKFFMSLRFITRGLL